MTNYSASDLGAFLECPRKWRLEKFWAPKKPRLAYWVGTTLHAGLEGYYLNGERDYDRAMSFLLKEGQTSLDKLAEKYQYIWGEVGPEFTVAFEDAQRIMTNYAIYDFETPLDGEVIQTEKYYRVHLSGDLTISGRIDLLMRRQGGVWVIDHKTAASRQGSGGLDVDEQLTVYSWLIWKSTGELPLGVLHNTIYKDVPKEPPVLKSGGLSKAMDQKTVASLYRAKIEELKLDEADYSMILDHLDKKGWEGFFSREGSSRSIEELMSFEKRTIVKAEMMTRAMIEPMTYAIPNPSIYRCGYCPFLSVCKSMDSGLDWEAQLDASFEVA